MLSTLHSGYFKCLHAPTVTEWPWDTSLLDSLQMLLEWVTPYVPAAAKPGRDLWRSELSMDANWATFQSPAQVVGPVMGLGLTRPSTDLDIDVSTRSLKPATLSNAVREIEGGLPSFAVEQFDVKQHESGYMRLWLRPQ